MSEWQPARLVGAHREEMKKRLAVPISDKQLRVAEKLIVRVAPAVPPSCVVDEYRKMGCNATRFFLLNNADLSKINYRFSHAARFACEHEVLSDRV